eukprot:941090-Pleurochrysis_carterae.AAC.1
MNTVITVLQRMHMQAKGHPPFQHPVDSHAGARQAKESSTTAGRNGGISRCWGGSAKSTSPCSSSLALSPSIGAKNVRENALHSLLGTLWIRKKLTAQRHQPNVDSGAASV